jgi:hypothetical protein
MKNKIKVFGLFILIVVFAFLMTACFGQGGSKIIKSAEELKTYLDSQSANSPDKPIKVSINANEQMIGKIAEVIKSTDKYVSLTFSGNGLTTIPDFAFAGCTSLASITIGNGVTRIGDAAFYNCTSLTSVTIPNSVTSIGGGAFRSCTSLASIIIPNSVTSIGDVAFMNCTSLASITIPDSVTSIGDGSFRSCTSLASITIGNGVTEIGVSSFEDCTSLASVTIGSGVTSIGGRAFVGCTSLTNVSIGNSLEYGEIDGSTFYSSNLTAINVAAGNNAYSSNDGILYNKNKTELLIYPPGKTASSFTIPNSVTSIGSYAFYGSTSLSSIIIPDSVTEIGGGAFNKGYDKTYLTSISIGADVEIQTYYYSEGNLWEGSFGSKFESVYINGGKRAGTYTRPNNESETWTSPNVFRENFSRVLELNTKRMNGPDVEALQKRLLYLGFSGVGEADGYYGPKTEEIIKTIQKFAGFDENGKVDRTLWDFIFYNDNLNIQ